MSLLDDHRPFCLRENAHATSPLTVEEDRLSTRPPENVGAGVERVAENLVHARARQRSPRDATSEPRGEPDAVLVEVAHDVAHRSGDTIAFEEQGHDSVDLFVRIELQSATFWYGPLAIPAIAERDAALLSELALAQVRRLVVRDRLRPLWPSDS